MRNRTKDRIYELIVEQTRKNTEPTRFDLEPFRARSIAEYLDISRNLASQYLNELFYEGKLIKIGTHPIYFLAKSEMGGCSIPMLMKVWMIF